MSSTDPDEWAQSLIGSELAGRYRLDEILGKGAFGFVFTGTHTWTERRVAVKVLNALLANLDPTMAPRFLREAKAAASLRHKHVVDVLDMGEDAGTAFLVLELLEGEPLSDRLHREPILDAPTTLPILLPIFDALHAAHERGMIHRDVKPANIYLHDEEGVQVPKILDFGTVRTSDASEAALTRQGALLGTPQYMSPEQLTGTALTRAADIWSCGVLAFRMLAGRFPFLGENLMEVLADAITKTAPPLSSVAPTVPRGIAAAVDRALVRAPEGRHADMHAFVDALLAGAREVGILVVDPRQR